jgi:hypothetical protein
MVSVTESIGIDGIDRNWTVNRWQEPKLMEHGFLAGQVSKGKWSVVGFFPTLGDALKRALDEALKDGVTAGTVTTLGELIAAVGEARAACLAVGVAETPSPSESQEK